MSSAVLAYFRAEGALVVLLNEVSPVASFAVVEFVVGTAELVVFSDLVWKLSNFLALSVHILGVSLVASITLFGVLVELLTELVDLGTVLLFR
jgi:hypothetical protein